jgi:thiol-disulfide isomerase/thioredoxin
MKKTLRSLFLLFTSFWLNPIHAEELNLDQYRGQVVYVDFWASWCLPCKKSFPWMNEMHQKYKDQGLKIIAINVDEESADADKFLADTPAEFTILRDPEGKLAKQYKLVGMPTSLLFDTQGKLVSRHVGFKKSKIQSYEVEFKKSLPNTTQTNAE